MSRLFGYARVSTRQQSLDLQLKRLTSEGVEQHRMFSDKLSGKNIDRPGLDMMQLKVEKGDVILVTKLDRLGRNTADMIAIIQNFHNIGVSVRFLDDNLSTEGTMGMMVITILAAVAQAERARIMERTNEGRAYALKKGVQFGRKPTIDGKKIVKLRNQRHSVISIANRLNISRVSVYTALKAANWTAPKEWAEYDKEDSAALALVQDQA